MESWEADGTCLTRPTGYVPGRPDDTPGPPWSAGSEQARRGWFARRRGPAPPLGCAGRDPREGDAVRRPAHTPVRSEDPMLRVLPQHRAAPGPLGAGQHRDPGRRQGSQDRRPPTGATLLVPRGPSHQRGPEVCPDEPVRHPAPSGKPARPGGPAARRGLGRAMGAGSVSLTVTDRRVADGGGVGNVRPGADRPTGHGLSHHKFLDGRRSAACPCRPSESGGHVGEQPSRSGPPGSRGRAATARCMADRPRGEPL